MRLLETGSREHPRALIGLDAERRCASSKIIARRVVPSDATDGSLLVYRDLIDRDGFGALASFCALEWFSARVSFRSLEPFSARVSFRSLCPFVRAAEIHETIGA